MIQKTGGRLIGGWCVCRGFDKKEPGYIVIPQPPGDTYSRNSLQCQNWKMLMPLT